MSITGYKQRKKFWLPITKMDTVEGVKAGKVILALMFMLYGFMVALLLSAKTSANVTEAFAVIPIRTLRACSQPSLKIVFYTISGVFFFVYR